MEFYLVSIGILVQDAGKVLVKAGRAIALLLCQ